MLAKRNRLVTAVDYRSTVRRGRRRSADHVVIYSLRTSPQGGYRFGFIISKSVGNAVQRNSVRRRLKSIAHSFAVGGHTGPGISADDQDVVIRALPGAAQLDWVTLESQVSALLREMGTTGTAREAGRAAGFSPSQDPTGAPESSEPLTERRADSE